MSKRYRYIKARCNNWIKAIVLNFISTTICDSSVSVYHPLYPQIHTFQVYNINPSDISLLGKRGLSWEGSSSCALLSLNIWYPLETTSG